MFALPKIPKISPSSSAVVGLPSFCYDDVTSLRLVGSGAYGKIYFGKYEDRDVCVKLLQNSEQDDVIKEAKFLYKLNHESVVTFYGLDLSNNAIMIEYLAFNFKFFGNDTIVSDVGEFLRKINTFQTKGFEHFIPFIAIRVVYALQYLHKSGVAHRDLKPGNVLISNLRFSEGTHETKWFQCQKWCDVKLTDYGESWGNILNATAMMKTHTVNVFKGTPAFMAPEVVRKKPGKMSENDLKLADVWSVGMLFFVLLNPDVKVPYHKEALKGGHINDWRNFLAKVTAEGMQPECSAVYEQHNRSVWYPVSEVFKKCVKVSPSLRVHLSDAATILEAAEKSTPYQLSCHQGTAITEAHKNHLTSDLIVVPDNDGTNGCTFLALRIAECLMTDAREMGESKQSFDWEQFATSADIIISMFPREFNKYRDINKTYFVDEAYKILFEKNLLSTCNLQLLSAGKKALTDEGIDEIRGSLSNGGVHVITVEPYTFLYGKLGTQYFSLDTHSISGNLGGNGNALLVVFDDSLSCMTWILRRCFFINPKDSYQEIIKVNFDADTNPIRSISPISSVGSSTVSHLAPHSEMKDESILHDGNIMSKIKDDRCREHWGQHKIPFISKHPYKLSNSNTYHLIKSEFPRSTKVPQNCKQNAIFLIDSKSISNNEDVKSDMNGTFHRCIEAKTVSLDLVSDKAGKEVLVRRKRTSEVGNLLKMHVNRREHESGLVRNIVYFCCVDNVTPVGNTIMLQYYINRRLAGDVDKVDYKATSHGNSKTEREFFATKKSTIALLKEQIVSSGNIRKIYTDCVATEGARVVGDKPRNIKQLYNIKTATKPQNEVESILALNVELEEEKFVWMHSDVPSDLWVLGTNHMIKELKNAASQYPISIDPTFNHGYFEVTPFTYRSHIFESKSKNVNGAWTRALLPGPILLHHSKDFETYDSAFRTVASTTHLNNLQFGTITDGEGALINAVKSNFQRTILGRCTNHFKTNCKKFITDNIGTLHTVALTALLDTVFGDNGLVEAEDKGDLQAKMSQASDLCDEIEVSAINASPSYVPRFSSYLKKNEKAVLRKMTRDVRKAIGLPIDSGGVPMRIYTNQSETQNSMLRAKKISLGYTKKSDVTKAIFIRDIWLGMIEEINLELNKAAYNQSDRYRLCPKAKYLEIDAALWYSMNQFEQCQYMKEIRSLSTIDLDVKKGIVVPTIENESSEVYGSLSVAISTAMPGLFHAVYIEKKALELLNLPNAITTNPSIGTDTGKCFLVAGSGKNVYKVSISSKQMLSCTCKGYQHVHICSHSVAVAEKQNLLQSHVTKAKQSCSSRSSITYPNNDKGAGRKGQVKRKHRNYGNVSTDADDVPPFTEVWHNNLPLEICSVRIIPADKVCGQCKKEFPRGVLTCVPFDIAFKHQEKWQYPNKISGDNEPRYLVSKLYTVKYYCVHKECVMRRFPYFVKDLLKVPTDLLLQPSHAKLIRYQFGFDI